MTGGHEVHAQLVGPPQERPELDLAVARGARVRGASGRVFLDEPGDHRLGELLGVVGDLEREPGDTGHGFGVGARRRATAPVLHPVQMHEVHVGAEHLVTLVGEQACGDRRVDPARHRHQDRTLRRHPTRLPLRAATYRS